MPSQCRIAGRWPRVTRTSRTLSQPSDCLSTTQGQLLYKLNKKMTFDARSQQHINYTSIWIPEWKDETSKSESIIHAYLFSKHEYSIHIYLIFDIRDCQMQEIVFQTLTSKGCTRIFEENKPFVSLWLYWTNWQSIQSYQQTHERFTSPFQWCGRRSPRINYLYLLSNIAQFKKVMYQYMNMNLATSNDGDSTPTHPETKCVGW